MAQRLAQRITQRSEAATRNNAWLERIAWHAAALAALGVMLLVLLGSLAWLDHWAPKSTRNDKAVIARRGELRGRGAGAEKLALPALMGDSEGCAPPSGAG